LEYERDIGRSKMASRALPKIPEKKPLPKISIDSQMKNRHKSVFGTGAELAASTNSSTPPPSFSVAIENSGGNHQHPVTSPSTPIISSLGNTGGLLALRMSLAVGKRSSVDTSSGTTTTTGSESDSIPKSSHSSGRKSLHYASDLEFTPKLNQDVKSELYQKERIIEELLETEKKYVFDLSSLVDVYQKPLEKLQLIPDQAVKSIFKNVSIIIGTSQKLKDQLTSYYEDFRKCSGVYSGGNSIGKIFLKFAPFLKIYSDFCNGYESVLNQVRTLRKENAKFESFMARAENDIKKNGGQSLAGYLIMPIQRIPRYTLLLRELLKVSDRTLDDYQNLESAIEKLMETTDIVNAKVKKYEAKRKVLDIQSRLLISREMAIKNDVDFDSAINLEHLIQPYRYFVYETTIIVFQDEKEYESYMALPEELRKQWCKPRIMLVFSDYIMFCNEEKDCLVPVADLLLSKNDQIESIPPATNSPLSIIANNNNNNNNNNSNNNNSADTKNQIDIKTNSLVVQGSSLGDSINATDKLENNAAESSKEKDSSSMLGEVDLVERINNNTTPTSLLFILKSERNVTFMAKTIEEKQELIDVLKGTIRGLDDSTVEGLNARILLMRSSKSTGVKTSFMDLLE